MMLHKILLLANLVAFFYGFRNKQNKKNTKNDKML